MLIRKNIRGDKVNRNSKLRKLIVIALILTQTITLAACDGNNKNSKGKNTNNSAMVSNNTKSEYSSIFEKDKVIDVKIQVGEEDLKAMLDNPLAEEYKNAQVTVNGTTVENVGIRTKGNLTLRSVASSDSDRYSFRIKLDEYVKGQNLLGLDEFVVNNMYSDPSYMREYLSYEALREIGANVPETTFANIYINDKLYGFYLCVEAIDDSYLKRNFGDNDGSLYKQEKGSTLQYVEGSNYDSYELKEGEDESKADLKNFIKALNEMPAGEKGNIESVLEVDSALKYIAANTVLGNYDSYNGNMSQNYYLYGENGKFTVLSWDYNMSIGGFGGGGGGTSATAIPIDEPVTGVNMKNLPLINNLLTVPEYKDKYHEYIKELVSYLENFESRVQEVAKIIRPYVDADPSKFYTMDQFETNIKYVEGNTQSATMPNEATGNKLAPTEIKPNENNSDKGKVNGNTSPDQNLNQSKNSTLKPDANTGATKQTNQNEGQMEFKPEEFERGQKGNRQGSPEGFKQGEKAMAPQEFNGENMPKLPDDFKNDNIQPPVARENMKGMPNGGGKNIVGGSIINYVKARIENIKKQLSGELSTTGNSVIK